MLADGSFQPSSQHTNCKKKKKITESQHLRQQSCCLRILKIRVNPVENESPALK